MQKVIVIITSFLNLFLLSAWGQDFGSDFADADDSLNQITLVNETIKKISPNRRIMILTNINRSFMKGDFITILLNQTRVTRAVVAKTEGDMSGIKILKTYNLPLWKQLKPSLEVQVIRGDDSYFKKEKKEDKKEKQEEEAVGQLDNEEDLFNDTTLLEDDDVTLEEDSKKVIKTDNILAAGYSAVQGIDKREQSTTYYQFYGSWSYQIADNIWTEFSYGRSVVEDFPDTGLDTTMNNFVLRAKFTFAGPFYSYFQPYIGYQLLTVDSPGAGQDPQGISNKTTAELGQELQTLKKLEKNEPVFGVTILKRLVPGWFFKFDLGTDLLSGGLALEF